MKPRISVPTPFACVSVGGDRGHSRIHRSMIDARTIVLLLGFLFSGFAIASPTPTPAPGRVALLTRPMAEFYHHEGTLSRAFQQGQVQQGEALLAPNFEVRIANDPGNPIPRAQWVHWMLRQHPTENTIDGMAVHDYGNVAIVSFHQHEVTGSSHAARDRFIVDVWMKQANRWLLSVRYSAAVRAEAVHRGAHMKD